MFKFGQEIESEIGAGSFSEIVIRCTSTPKSRMPICGSLVHRQFIGKKPPPKKTKKKTPITYDNIGAGIGLIVTSQVETFEPRRDLDARRGKRRNEVRDREREARG